MDTYSLLGARTSRPQLAEDERLIFALRAQCGRDVRAPSCNGHAKSSGYVFER
jgi:hypothetical protein